MASFLCGDLSGRGIIEYHNGISSDLLCEDDGFGFSQADSSVQLFDPCSIDDFPMYDPVGLSNLNTSGTTFRKAHGFCIDGLGNDDLISQLRQWVERADPSQRNQRTGIKDENHAEGVGG